MHKYLGLLILPFAFTVLVDVTVNNLDLKDEKLYLALKKNIISINVHLNNQKSFESIEKMHLVNNYNSMQINKMYSEKFIDKDFLLEFNIEKKIFDKSVEEALVNSIQFSNIKLANYNWKKMFSQKICFLAFLSKILAF